MLSLSTASARHPQLLARRMLCCFQSQSSPRKLSPPMATGGVRFAIPGSQGAIVIAEGDLTKFEGEQDACTCTHMHEGKDPPHATLLSACM